MKKALFIDTNIYLRFYDSNSAEFKKLLKSINEVKKNIFITKQIQNEIERNKLNVFMTSFKSHDKQFNLNNILLPEHLEAKQDKEIKTWNKTTNEIAKQTKEQKKKLKEITGNLIKNISESKDEVSKSLIKVYSIAIEAELAQIDKARKRKEIGNPPGKNNDPLGDQITWEQLLDQANTIEELWIITNDSDYFFEFDKKFYLNAFLSNELRQTNNSIKIYCFNTLSEGFSAFNKSEKINTLPTDEELEIITIEEKNSNLFHEYLQGLTDSSIGSSLPLNYREYVGVSLLSTRHEAIPNSHLCLGICESCGRKQYLFSQNTSNSSEIWVQFYRCPICSRYFCEYCWPHSNNIKSNLVPVDGYNDFKCPRCTVQINSY